MKKNRDPRIETDSDFIVAPKHGNSLNKLLENNPDGVPDSVICKALQLSQEEIDKIYETAIMKLRGVMIDDE